MADRTFFQDVFARHGSADARHNNANGIGDRIFERRRTRLFSDYEFDRFDILRRRARRGVNRRAFFGQRVAKDYAGAAVLIPYFILLIVLMYLTNPFLRV